MNRVSDQRNHHHVAIRGNARPSSSLAESEWDTLAGKLSLSLRQRQILQCVFDGQDQASIASELGIKRDTVHAHLARIYDKLNVHSRCELVVRAFLAYIDETRGKQMIAINSDVQEGMPVRRLA